MDVPFGWIKLYVLLLPASVVQLFETQVAPITEYVILVPSIDKCTHLHLASVLCTSV